VLVFNLDNLSVDLLKQQRSNYTQILNHCGNRKFLISFWLYRCKKNRTVTIFFD